MKPQLLFVHSAGAQDIEESSSVLLGHLKSGLESSYDILALLMPDPDDPRFDAWGERIGQVLPRADAPLVLAGHSLGGSVLVKYLSEQELTLPISGLALIAAPYWSEDRGWSGADFMLHDDYANRLTGRCPIFLYHSRDDDVVPFEHLSFYATDLPTATMRALDGYGHYFREEADAIVRDLLRLGDQSPSGIRDREGL